MAEPGWYAVLTVGVRSGVGHTELVADSWIGGLALDPPVTGTKLGKQPPWSGRE